ncbi:hypothetical protein MRB53_001007 [Persea americana]|uniref:Uncharacterized protein n=1 Tax=Persea americana TaxID=3435 RepID=A0ACC2MRI3_PERAE|nr:hypothetical protein MRB53_001007 [Persea americana]
MEEAPDQYIEELFVPVDAPLGHVEEDAAGVVELGSAAEDLNDLVVGRPVVAEAGLLDPPEKLEGLVGGASAVEDVVDERVVEVGYELAD